MQLNRGNEIPRLLLVFFYSDKGEGKMINQNNNKLQQKSGDIILIRFCDTKRIGIVDDSRKGVYDMGQLINERLYELRGEREREKGVDSNSHEFDA